MSSIPITPPVPAPPALVPAVPVPAAHPLRWVRTAAVLAGAGLRPAASSRALGGAARLLTARGVRVRVLPPAVAWPRVRPGTPGLLVVADSGADLAHLALVTAVPGVVAAGVGRRGRLAAALRLPGVPETTGTVAAALDGGTTVTVRPGADGRLSPAGFVAAATVGAPVCPVAVRSRTDGGSGGLLVELHLLPQVAGAGGHAVALAAGARRALAAADGLRPR